jgi:hypothetical protein
MRVRRSGYGSERIDDSEAALRRAHYGDGPHSPSMQTGVAAILLHVPQSIAAEHSVNALSKRKNSFERHELSDIAQIKNSLFICSCDPMVRARRKAAASKKMRAIRHFELFMTVSA